MNEAARTEVIWVQPFEFHLDRLTGQAGRLGITVSQVQGGQVIGERANHGVNRGFRGFDLLQRQPGTSHEAQSAAFVARSTERGALRTKREALGARCLELSAPWFQRTVHLFLGGRPGRHDPWNPEVYRDAQRANPPRWSRHSRGCTLIEQVWLNPPREHAKTSDPALVRAA